jgi:hypothetical protein
VCDAKALHEQWARISTGQNWRRLRKGKLHVRERPDGTYAVVDGYGWGVEFARFKTRECAGMLVAIASLSTSYW